MIKNRKTKWVMALAIAIYIIGVSLFYLRYVPLVKPFQMALIPILSCVLVLTFINSQWGILFFSFTFPLINGLPYFFGIYETTPHAPTALLLFLFFFLGFLLHHVFHESPISLKETISKPLILFSIVIFLSGIITFLRYSNFFPFLSDHIYELTTNSFGVTAGGAIMSVWLFSLSYLTGMACFVIFLDTVKSRDFLKRILVLLCFSTLISLGFGLFQRLKNMTLGSNPWTFSQGLINATFKDSLSLGAFLAMIIPLASGIGLAFKGLIRLFSFLIALFSFIMLLFSGSKSGLLSLIISFTLFSILSLIGIVNSIKAKPRSFKKIDWTSVVVTVLVTIALFAGIRSNDYLREELTRSQTLARIKLLFKPENSNSIFHGRADRLWKMAWPMIKDYPLSGVGIGGYIIESSNYSQRYATDIGTPESAENYMLQVGSELGLIGIILVLWILWEIIKQVRRSYLKIPATDDYRFILIGAISGIVSFLLMVQIHTFIGSYEIQYTFWLLVGIVFYLGRTGEDKDESSVRKPLFNRTQKIASVVILSSFAGVHLWNSTHSLSLRSRTEQFGLKQDFGFYQLEKTTEGREFRWTREYGGLTVKLEKPIIAVPLLASHPDIQQNPVKVRIYVVKDFFKHKKLIDEVTLNRSNWKTYEYKVPDEVGQEIILLVRVSRTWNPQKAFGTPDPRNLGVAIGKIEFREERAP